MKNIVFFFWFCGTARGSHENFHFFSIGGGVKFCLVFWGVRLCMGIPPPYPSPCPCANTKKKPIPRRWIFRTQRLFQVFIWGSASNMLRFFASYPGESWKSEHYAAIQLSPGATREEKEAEVRNTFYINYKNIGKLTVLAFFFVDRQHD